MIKFCNILLIILSIMAGTICAEFFIGKVGKILNRQSQLCLADYSEYKKKFEDISLKNSNTEKNSNVTQTKIFHYHNKYFLNI